MSVNREGSAYINLALGFILAGSSVLPGSVLAKLPVLWATAAGAAVALVPLMPLAALEARRSVSKEGGPGYLRELRRALPLLAVQALFGMALFRALMLAALTRTSAAEVGIATSATPAITALLATFVLRERIGPRAALGVALVVAGIALLDAGGIEADTLSTGPAGARVEGILLAVGAAASESIFNILSKRLPGRIGPMANSAIVTFLAFAMLAIPAFATGESAGPGILDAPALVALAYQGLFVSALAYIFFYRGSARLPAATIGAFSGFIPLTGLVASMTFLGQKPTLLALAGSILAIGGVLLCAAGTAGRKAPSAQA